MTHLRFVVASAALALALTAPGVAQQQPARDAATPALTGTCALGGVVTSDDRQGRPIRRATVSISGGDLRLQRVTATDDRGRFVIADLGPGRYTVNVSKPGWVTTFLGARRPGRGPGLAIALTEGQQITDLAVKLTPGGVITGRILDQNGVPQSGVRPMVMQYRTLGGERVLTQAATSAISMLGMTTDDRGEYRVFGLAPGAYYIAASMPAAGGRLTTNEEIAWAQQRQAIPGGTSSPVPPPGPAIAFPPIYYPGTTNLQQASAINLAAGEERRGIDLVLQPVMTARVAGRVTGHDGQPARAVQVVISAVGAKSTLEAARQAAVSDQNGAFEFASVIPGQYTLSARGSTQPAPAPPAPGEMFVAAGPSAGGRTLDLWAAAEITVSSQDVTGLAIALEPGLTISGKVAFDATTLVPPADFSRVQITVSAARQPSSVVGMPTNMHAAPVRADGTFQLAGIAPDNYVITGYVPGGGLPETSWMVKSVTMGGENVADRPVAIKSAARSSEVVITFTDRHAELAGRLLDTAGRPAPEYFVFVFSTNRSYWTPNATRQLRPPTRPASDGTYRITALPPGEYYVAALTEVDDADIYDAAFLEQVAAAAFKITIAEGEKKKQDLQIGNR